MSHWEQDMNKFTPVGRSTNGVAETFIVVICYQLSNIPYIFRNCDLLVLNKSHEKKLHDKKILLQIVMLKAYSWKLSSCD